MQAQRFDVLVVLFDGHLGFACVVQAIKRVVRQKKDRQDEGPFFPQVKGPREGDPVQETKEERRVAKGSEQTAAVGHDEDCEEHGVDLVHTLAVRRQERTDEQHRCAGCADKGRKNAADCKEERVVARSCSDITREVDAARYYVEREQQADELEILNSRVNERSASGLPEHPGARRDR